MLCKKIKINKGVDVMLSFLLFSFCWCHGLDSCGEGETDRDCDMKTMGLFGYELKVLLRAFVLKM